jgi:DNA invertase Pin-like site-specific DNA recombinase
VEPVNAVTVESRQALPDTVRCLVAQVRDVWQPDDARARIARAEEFRALGIEFVSIHEGVDTSTPNGRLVFGIFASIAEFERELIRERVKSGLRNARAKGKTLGRPRKVVDVATVAALRARGVAWRAISDQLEVGVATLYRLAHERSKTQEKDFGT